MSADWDDGTPTKTKTECINWKKGTCTRGSKCRYLHVGKKGADVNKPNRQSSSGAAGSERPVGPNNKRCAKDLKGEKCEFGANCWFAHRHSINPRKDANTKSPTRDYSKTTCNACGTLGHSMWKCAKLKAHTDDLKKAIGYTGDPKWLMDSTNSKKCIEVFKRKQWFATAVHNPMPQPDPQLDDMSKAGTPLKKGQLPYKIEKDWTDAGWCWIGWGANRIQLRLFIDPRSTCSFSTEGLYDKVAPLAKSGKLGAARIATEVPKIVSDAWNGKKDVMGRWMQLQQCYTHSDDLYRAVRLLFTRRRCTNLDSRQGLGTLLRIRNARRPNRTGIHRSNNTGNVIGGRPTTSHVCIVQ